MKTSNLAAVVGRKKCRKVLTKAAVHIQKKAYWYSTADWEPKLGVHGDFLYNSFRKYRNDYQEEVSQPFLSQLYINYQLLCTDYYLFI